MIHSRSDAAATNISARRGADFIAPKTGVSVVVLVLTSMDDELTASLAARKAAVVDVGIRLAQPHCGEHLP
jgi:hypothetical protein